jgi:hypothetical protein
MSLVGLIVSIIANNQSKAAGYKNPMAKAGIIISIVLMVIGIIIGIFFAVAGASLFGGLIDMCQQLGEGVWEVDGVTYTCG